MYEWGVQIAQIYGVRIHLLGIRPSRASQSQHLLQEADTTNEWDAATVAKFLFVRPPKLTAEIAKEPAMTPILRPEASTVPVAAGTETPLDAVVEAFVETLVDSDLDGISVYWETERGVPSEFDRKLLPCGRTALGRNLERDEIKHVRAKFQALVKARIKNREAASTAAVALPLKPRQKSR